MTATRPYRKALPVEEALARLGDAAGSQLDERIVKIFLDGFESAANPPLPGETTGLRAWSLRPEAA
jgi:HD-GYP domain-containing protein (c-di-GMP phosphodiesterase class II)